MSNTFRARFIGYTKRLSAITVEAFDHLPGIVAGYLPATLESGFAYFDVGASRYRIPAEPEKVSVAELVQAENAAARFVANVAEIDKALAEWIAAEIASGRSVENIRERIARAYGVVSAERADNE